MRPQGDLASRGGDSHEAHLTADDTVVLIVCPETNVNLTSFGGLESEPVLNCHVQEVEPVENKVLFQFATLDFFDVSDTYWVYKGTGVYDLGTGAFDFCHMNSVEKVRIPLTSTVRQTGSAEADVMCRLPKEIF